MARAVGMNHIAIEVGSLGEPDGARHFGLVVEFFGGGMGLELQKSESALQELRDKGLADG